MLLFAGDPTLVAGFGPVPGGGASTIEVFFAPYDTEQIVGDKVVADSILMMCDGMTVICTVGHLCVSLRKALYVTTLRENS
jgi:hypothetical protein